MNPKDSDEERHLDEGQIDRYFHHIALKDIGGEGQKRLLGARVLIVGLGGLGSPVSLYLAAAGVGTLGLVDDDRVELSNLQRQIVHSMEDIGHLKVESAKDRLVALNTDVNVIAHGKRLIPENAEAIVSDYDFIVDGSDNFTTKFLINDTCVGLGKPFSHGGVVGFTGQTFTHVPGSLCYRCVFPGPPPDDVTLTCRGAGILGAVAGMIGATQAAETIKFILGREELLKDRMLIVDALSMRFRTVSLKRHKLCPACNSNVRTRGVSVS
jgi:molybdopterin/thiamine biosynthesis adenylyltransferase